MDTTIERIHQQDEIAVPALIVRAENIKKNALFLQQLGFDPHLSTKLKGAKNTSNKNQHKQRLLLQDEEGQFNNIIGRSDQDNVTSPFALTGVYVSLKAGGHRIYWQGVKEPYEIPRDEDKGLESLIAIGYLKLGEKFCCVDY